MSLPANETVMAHLGLPRKCSDGNRAKMFVYSGARRTLSERLGRGSSGSMVLRPRWFRNAA
jgi:hypothetical protein